MSAIGMEQRGQVGAVVHGDRRRVVEHGVDVLVIGVGVLAADGEHGDALGDEGRGGIVLGRERVGGAEQWLGPTVAGAPA